MGMPALAYRSFEISLSAPHALASTPDAVIARLNQAVNEALKQSDIRQMIEGSGGIVAGGTPEAYGKFIAQERAKWGPIIKNARITLE